MYRCVFLWCSFSFFFYDISYFHDMDQFQMGRYVDKKLDKAEDLLRKKERKAKRWFNRISGDEEEFVFEEIHVFLASYLIGLVLGLSFGIVAR